MKGLTIIVMNGLDTIIMANHSAEDIEVLWGTVSEMNLGILTKIKE